MPAIVRADRFSWLPFAGTPGFQEVIKTLGRAYRNIQGISGATILGDGSVTLILDVPHLVREEVLEESRR